MHVEAGGWEVPERGERAEKQRGRPTVYVAPASGAL